MNATLKKYFTVSLTLGLIAGCSALLIGLTNLVTADRIAYNKNKAEIEGLKQVFEDETLNITADESFDSTSYEFVLKKWNVTTAEDQFFGTIYKTSGKNDYGLITLLLGFTSDNTFSNMVVLENTETYGSTLQENYIDKVNNGEIDYTEVTCGATYGAKTIQSMIDEAKEDLQKSVKEVIA